MATSTTRGTGRDPDDVFYDNEHRRPPSRGGRPWLTLLAILAIIAAGFALTLALVDDESGGPEQAVTLQELAEDPAQYRNQVVTVSGGVTRTLGQGFLIGEQLDQSVLVVSAQGITPVLQQVGDEDVVQVTGAVRAFNDVDFTELYGGQFDGGLFEEYRDQALIVARSIDPTIPDTTANDE